MWLLDRFCALLEQMWRVLFLSFILATGCSHTQPAAVPPSRSPSPSALSFQSTNQLPDKSLKPIVTPSRAISGRVVTVNANARYVVLSYPIGGVPPLDSRLSVYREGLKVGELKVTGPQRDNNTVADITAGECLPGDQVKRE
ncbi:MAG TPA: hypothetical protein VGE41_07960 [Verrucomicrobiae bacterium]